MNIATQVINRINLFCGMIVTVLSYVLGAHWFLFIGFLLLNAIDYITGCIKAYINNQTNSHKGFQGIVKKFGYWMMILASFAMSAIFTEIGKTIGVNLEISSLIGWFVLATLMINEFRSIVENFVEAGYDVPKMFSKGLEVASNALDLASKTKSEEEKKEE